MSAVVLWGTLAKGAIVIVHGEEFRKISTNFAKNAAGVLEAFGPFTEVEAKDGVEPKRDVQKDLF